MTDTKIITYCKAITQKGWLCTNNSTFREYCTVHKKQNSYECVVCYEKTNKPFRLKCNHGVCNDCFIKWCEKCEDNNANVSCPICRHDCSKEWLAYTNNIINHKNYIGSACDLLNQIRLKNGSREGNYSQCIEIHVRLFTRILSKPTFLSMNPIFYDIFRIQINLLVKNKKSGINKKMRKMFGAFNEKYKC